MKRGLIIILMFLLLAMTAALPVLLLRHENESLMGRVSVYDSEVLTMEREENNGDMDIWQRAELVSGAVIEVQSSEYVAADDKTVTNVLVKSMEEQIELMQGCNALPYFELSGEPDALCAQRIYMHPDNPQASVDMWLVTAGYEEHDVYAYMDMELSAVYEIAVISREGSFTYGKDVSAVGFVDYLALFSQDGERNDGLDVRRVYADDLAYLGLLPSNAHRVQVRTEKK